MFYLVLIPLLLYAMLVAALYVTQRRLIYLPERSIGPPGQYGLAGFREHFADTADSESIQLWHCRAREGFPTLVYYHGNAWHMGGRSGIYAALAERGFGVLGVSYRGYGKSSGEPSEAGLYRDARAAIDFLTERMGVPLSKILLYGESLGTGVAVQMAVEREVGAVILQAPYISVAARAAELYYYVPVALLIKDKYHTLRKIGRVRAPVLLFHGERDPVIPQSHGRQVYEAITAPKQAFFFPGGGHNDFDGDVIAAHVLDFAQTHHLIG